MIALASWHVKGRFDQADQTAALIKQQHVYEKKMATINAQASATEKQVPSMQAGSTSSHRLA